MLPVTLKQLRTFATVARSRTLAAAADALGITPPAVTIQLRLLEDGIGLPLLERSSAGHKLTAAGQEVLAAATRIEQALAGCEAALAEMKGLQSGAATLGVVGPAQYFAPAAIAAFKAAYPGIEVHLSIGNRAGMIEALDSLAVDLVIMGRPPDTLDVHSALVGDNPHVVVAPPGHPLARAQAMAQSQVQSQVAASGGPRKRLTLATVAKERFLVREPGSGTRALMEHRWAEAGVTPKVAMEIASAEVVKQAVMAGLGLAFVSAHTVASELEDGRLVVLDVAGLPVMRQWYLVHNAGRRLLPAAEQLRLFLEAELPRLLPKVPVRLGAC